MANTNFLLDLYPEGINELSCLFLYRYMVRLALGKGQSRGLTLYKQVFNI